MSKSNVLRTTKLSSDTTSQLSTGSKPTLLRSAAKSNLMDSGLLATESSPVGASTTVHSSRDKTDNTENVWGTDFLGADPRVSSQEFLH